MFCQGMIVQLVIYCFCKISPHDYENRCSLYYLSIEENHVKSDDSCMILLRGRSLWDKSLLEGNSFSISWQQIWDYRNRFQLRQNDLRLANKLEAYDNIIQEQRASEIIEKVEEEEVNETVTERVFYLT